MRKQGSCLEKEAMQGTMPGARRRGRPRTAWMDNIKTWTGLPVDESVRMTEDSINGKSKSMVWPALGSRTAKEQNRMEHFSIGNGQPCREPTSCICTLSLPTQTATAQRCASVLLATALCLSVCLSVTSRAFC